MQIHLKQFVLRSGIYFLIFGLINNKIHAQERPLSVLTSLSASSNLYHQDDANHAAALEVSVDPNYVINDKYKLKARLAWEKELTNKRNSKILDGSLGIERKIKKFSEFLSLIGSLNVLLPLDEKYRKDSSVITKISLSPTFILDLRKSNIRSLDAMTLTYTPQLVKEFYQYETTKTGISNTKHAFKQILTLGYSPFEKLSLKMLFRYNLSWTQGNNKNDDSFQIAEEISYALPADFSVDLGHVNEGKAIKDDGYSSNVSIYDDNSSLIYATLSKQF